MKLSASTLAILSNFAAINPNILVTPGKPLSTIANANNIVGFADVPEKFEKGFGIYDLSTFLSAYNLLDDPEITLGEESATISSGAQKVSYRFADKSILKVLEKEMKLPDMDVSVELSEEIIAKARKAAQVLSLSIVSITRENGVISIAVLDPKNPSADTWSAVLDENSTGPDFDFQFLIANLKIITGSYIVGLSKKFISSWAHSTQPVKYFIAIEKTSSYGS